MKWSDIRTRVMLAAWLPALMVGIGLSAAFLLGRSSDLNDAYQQRSRALARQLASASEYGIFSANVAQLHAISLGATKEPDVRSVDIFDSHGNRLIRVGAPLAWYPVMGMQESSTHDETSDLDILVQPVHSSQIELDDVFEVTERTPPAAAQGLGHVVLVMSRHSLVAREHSMLMLGFFITSGGLLLGALVAYLIARAQTAPGRLCRDPHQSASRLLPRRSRPHHPRPQSSRRCPTRNPPRHRPRDWLERGRVQRALMIAIA